MLFRNTLTGVFLAEFENARPLSAAEFLCPKLGQATIMVAQGHSGHSGDTIPISLFSVGPELQGEALYRTPPLVARQNRDCRPVVWTMLGVGPS